MMSSLDLDDLLQSCGFFKNTKLEKIVTSNNNSMQGSSPCSIPLKLYDSVRILSFAFDFDVDKLSIYKTFSFNEVKTIQI